MPDISSSPEIGIGEVSTTPHKLKTSKFQTIAASVQRPEINPDEILRRETTIREELKEKMTEKVSVFDKAQQKVASGMARVLTSDPVINTSANLFGESPNQPKPTDPDWNDNVKFPLNTKHGPLLPSLTEYGKAIIHHPEVPVRFVTQLSAQIIRRLVGG